MNYKYITIRLMLFLTGLILLSNCNFNKRDNHDVESLDSFSLNNSQEQYSSNAFNLSNKAMEKASLFIPPSTASDTSMILSVINILDSAITMDSTYYSAYVNKSTLLSYIGKYKSAIIVMDRIIEIKANYAEGFLVKGILYEKQGKINHAYTEYKKALIEYDNRIETTNKLDDKLNRAFVLLLIDSEKGNIEIKRLIKQYPNNENIIFWKKQLFDNFDREAYIEEY